MTNSVSNRRIPWTPREQLWQGRTVYIVAGGTSVTEEMRDSLRGRTVIVLNAVYRSCPWATAMMWSDVMWWRNERHRNLRRLKAFEGFIVTPRPGYYNFPLRVLIDGWTRSVRGRDDLASVRNGRTVVVPALSLAYVLGADRAVLVGVDNRGVGGRNYFHTEHGSANKRWRDKYNVLRRQARAIEDTGKMEVINSSPISTLDFWPMVPLHEVIASEESGRGGAD